jgi:hypothetical protein
VLSPNLLISWAWTRNWWFPFINSHALCNIIARWVLWWGDGSLSPNPQAGGPPLVGCPRLLTQYIRSYPLYLEAVSSIRKATTHNDVVTGIHLTWEINSISRKIHENALKTRLLNTPWNTQIRDIVLKSVMEGHQL